MLCEDLKQSESSDWLNYLIQNLFTVTKKFFDGSVFNLGCILKTIRFGLIEMQAENSLCCRFCKVSFKHTTSHIYNTGTWT